jgi:hypothetical protein
MSAIFAAIAGKIFNEMAQQILAVVKSGGNNEAVTENDIRATIEKVLVESRIIFKTPTETHLIHEAEKYNTCVFKISRGARIGCACGNRIRVKKGVINDTGLCTIHLKSTKKAESNKKCTYVPEKGKKAGEVCGASIKTPGHFCSKHRTVKSKSDSDASDFSDGDDPIRPLSDEFVEEEDTPNKE